MPSHLVMATANKKVETFEKYKQKIYLQNSQNTYAKSVKPFLYIGRIAGVFPVGNFLTVDHGTDTKLYFFYLYSFCLLCYKVVITAQFWNLLSQYNKTTNKKQLLTDYIAGALGFLFGFCYGTFAHILSVWKLTSFLSTVKSIQAYDTKYDFEDSFAKIRSRFIARKAFLGILCAIVVIYTPIYMLYNTVLRHEMNFEFEILPGIYTRSVPLICTYMTFGFIILEFGATYIYFQLFSVGKVLEIRLVGIMKMIEQKNKEMVKAYFGSTNIKPDLPACAKSWETIANQYMDFRETFIQYQEMSAPYFTILYSTLIIACVCLIYTLMNSGYVFSIKSEAAIQFSVIISLGRIYGLANIGEKFKTKYRRLVKIMMFTFLNENLEGKQLQQFKGILKQVTTFRVMLSAAGFFIVSRQNVTSIVSVIITYIVVLLQFSSADNKLVTSGPFQSGGFGGNYGGSGSSFGIGNNSSINIDTAKIYPSWSNSNAYNLTIDQ